MDVLFPLSLFSCAGKTDCCAGRKCRWRLKCVLFNDLSAFVISSHADNAAYHSLNAAPIRCFISGREKYQIIENQLSNVSVRKFSYGMLFDSFQDVVNELLCLFLKDAKIKHVNNANLVEDLHRNWSHSYH